jgi:hypothetical protein
MVTWWASDGPREQGVGADQPDQAPAPAQPVTEPPPRSPVESVAEAIEQLFLAQPELTRALLDALSSCAAADLQTLFGAAPARPDRSADYRSRTPAGGRGENPHSVTVAEQPATAAVAAPTDPMAGWRWDERGYRISPKLPSSFPRYNPQPTGSHWSW